MSLRTSSSSSSSNSNSWGDPRPTTTGPGGVEKVWSDEPTPAPAPAASSSNDRPQQGEMSTQRPPTSSWRELRAQQGGQGGGTSSSSVAQQGRQQQQQRQQSYGSPWDRPASDNGGGGGGDAGQGEELVPGQFTQREVSYLPTLQSSRLQSRRIGYLLGAGSTFALFQYHRYRTLPAPRPSRSPFQIAMLGFVVLGVGAPLGGFLGELRGAYNGVKGAKGQVEDQMHFLQTLAMREREGVDRARQGLREGRGKGAEGREQQGERDLVGSEVGGAGGEGAYRGEDQSPLPQGTPASSSWQAIRSQRLASPSPSYSPSSSASPPESDPFSPPPSSAAAAANGESGDALSGGGSRWAQLRRFNTKSGTTWDRLRAGEGGGSVGGRQPPREEQEQQQREETW
ncbi:hypothetical protein BDZ90DRAFT_104189 [Jaminaea rosea]|uniref:Uncharacterized protein n=1 Tax=Jaminaea rosea TaxID=1569628 RepID=A0A316V1I3_9BASI|nr:hypothetical protein BDZ90DRAFT_104189 [Jaminaea rosea]PWN29275.1 hypothetical protein BDZ90DRAFT_104189 [Jaminaea rosea]